MIIYNRIFSMAIFIVFMTMISCKDNSTNNNSPSIEINDATATLFQLNTDGCDFGSGNIGSAFLIELNIDSSSDIEIDGIEFDITFVGGAEFENSFTDDFDLTNDGLEFIRCFRFGETQEVIMDIRILANDETIESNEITISIDRPDGANKEIDS